MNDSGFWISMVIALVPMEILIGALTAFGVVRLYEFIRSRI